MAKRRKKRRARTLCKTVESRPIVVTRSIRGWGVAATLAATSEALLARAIDALPKGFRVGRGPADGRAYEIRRRSDGSIEFRRGDLLLFLGQLGTRLREAIAGEFESLASTDSSEFAFLHAGCVEVDGRAIVMPGRSHAGKSTLVAAFLKRGARYLSDDMAPIDRRLRAHPFPRPLGIRGANGGSPVRTSLKKLRARPARGPIPIAAVWSGTYSPLASTTTCDRKIGGAGFAEMLAQAPGAQIRPDVLVPILAAMARRVPVYAGKRGEADQAVDALLALIKRTKRR